MRTSRRVDRLDDRDAWAAALAGDAASFATLFDRHRDRVYRHGLRLSGKVHDAEDLTAGAFLELWRRRRSVRLVDGSVRPWLLVTTTNLSRNQARSIRRYRALLERLPRTEARPDAGEVALDRLEAEHAATRLREALRELRAADAALLVLVGLEGCSLSQAALVLGVREGTARVRLHRARARLAALVSPEAPEARLLVEAEVDND